MWTIACRETSSLPNLANQRIGGYTCIRIFMRQSNHTRIRQWRSTLQPCWTTMAFCGLLVLGSCHREAPATIAVIPRTTATPLWESEHLGAKAIAAKAGVHIYWNAPTS